ncbi:MAG: BatA domain-containing protein, partial [Myxococcota bacterium]|nr:BatA domain-containing protein [Myxococcota bacterium]
MSLGLLGPAALGLLVLVAGPILAHLARQEPVQRIPFGAMLLLARLVKKLRRRRLLRDRLLLLLRVLAVLAIVLAAARPELRWPGGVPEYGRAGAVVVVLDNSLSMDLVHDEG